MKAPESTPDESFDDDIIDAQIEAAAAVERQDAVLASHAWNCTPSQPFSIRRETLYFRLRAVNDALPIYVVRKHPEAFLHEAMIILWLCYHEPSAWEHLRSNNSLLINEVETWAEKNIRRNQQSQAIELALQILQEGDATHAIPRPSDRQGDELGN